jgi:sugar fermentation stimulation protein A
MMISDFVYSYPTLYPGILIKRYKRFFADIELASGEVITAHCPNTGPMTGVYIPGNPVQVSYSNNPKRKLAYTWEMIQLCDNNEPTWVGVNTSLPNRIIKLALEKKIFPELGNYEQVLTEVVYGVDRKSRVDFVLTGTTIASPIYVEVKNTTWTKERLALFPDTVTERGQKHLRELMALIPNFRPVMLYFINRGDCTHFSPGDSADPVYGELLRKAMFLGLEVLACRFEVLPAGVRYLGLAEVEI